MQRVTSLFQHRPISPADTIGPIGFTGLKLSIGLGSGEQAPEDRTRVIVDLEEALGDPEGRGIRPPNL